MATRRRPDAERGRLADDHELSAWSRAYGERVLDSRRWPISAVDDSRIAWGTTTRTRRRNGQCTYDPDGDCTVTVAEHVHERAGYRGCKPVVRHELVHAWQHQHRGSDAVVTDDGPVLLEGDARGDVESRLDVDTDGDVESVRAVVAVEPGHGPSFRAWVDPLELDGRCSTPYERTRADFRYVLECPDCGDWWGRHRLCETVRQAAHGRVGTAGYRYCRGCETLLQLRCGELYLDHAAHADDAIRAFVDGEPGTVPTTPTDGIVPTARSTDG